MFKFFYTMRYVLLGCLLASGGYVFCGKKQDKNIDNKRQCEKKFICPLRQLCQSQKKFTGKSKLYEHLQSHTGHFKSDKLDSNISGSRRHILSKLQKELKSTTEECKQHLKVDPKKEELFCFLKDYVKNNASDNNPDYQIVFDQEKIKNAGLVHKKYTGRSLSHRYAEFLKKELPNHPAYKRYLLVQKQVVDYLSKQNKNATGESSSGSASITQNKEPQVFTTQASMNLGGCGQNKPMKALTSKKRPSSLSEWVMTDDDESIDYVSTLLTPEEIEREVSLINAPESTNDETIDEERAQIFPLQEVKEVLSSINNDIENDEMTDDAMDILFWIYDMSKYDESSRPQ